MIAFADMVPASASFQTVQNPHQDYIPANETFFLTPDHLLFPENPDLTKNQSTKNVPGNHLVHYVNRYEPHLTDNSGVLKLLPDSAEISFLPAVHRAQYYFLLLLLFSKSNSIVYIQKIFLSRIQLHTIQ